MQLYIDANTIIQLYYTAIQKKLHEDQTYAAMIERKSPFNDETIFVVSCKMLGPSLPPAMSGPDIIVLLSLYCF